MNALEAATLDELVDEVARRHKAILLVYVTDHHREAEVERFGVCYQGGFTVCCGLAARAVSYFAKESVTPDGAVEAEGDDDE